ncbi:MAG TPA: MBL fold metallo-hydrolase [Actinomycetota bacterium]|nr:MBL fold metallo-hydrolase [Actinomycetota bacterium]
MIRLTVLGSCGTYPAPGRACSGYLLEAAPDRDGGRSVRVWVDTGGGTLSNLLRYVPPTELDAIWVSHLHVDHCSDLPLAYYALRYGDYEPRAARLPVYGPAGWAGHLGEFMSRGTGSTLEDVFEVCELADGERLAVGPLELTAVATVHSLETYGVRAAVEGRTLAYSADSGPCEGLGRLADGADLFLCEAAWTERPPGADPHHLTPAEAGRYAASACARRLVLTHLRPHEDPEAALGLAGEAYGGDVDVAVEGNVYQLGGTP